MRLDEAVDALRALGDDRDDAAASATRLRIRDSLARGHALRRHAAMFSVLAVLLVASGAWALTSGRVARWISPPAAQAPAVPPDMSAPLVTRPAPHVMVSVPDVSETRPAPHVTVSAADVVAAPEVGPSVSRVASAPHAAEPRATAHDGAAADANAAEAEALYRAAHELHFHGDDVAAALAAWDAYLAVSPHGAFAIEARYNRALCLVKLGRLAEARDGLAPFAAGDVAPAGYRRDEAARLIERIDQRIGGRRNPVNGSR
jgi:hypothetical protein